MDGPDLSLWLMDVASTDVILQAGMPAMMSADTLARLMGVALLAIMLSIQTLMFGTFIWYVLWLLQRSADRGLLGMFGWRAPRMRTPRNLGWLGFATSVSLLAVGTAFHIRGMNVEWTKALLMLTLVILLVTGALWLVDTVIILSRKARARFGRAS